jgi:hypothetical protein
MQRHIPKDHYPQLQHCKNLKTFTAQSHPKADIDKTV